MCDQRRQFFENSLRTPLMVAILAFHMTFLERLRDPLVVDVYSLAVHDRGDMEEAIDIAKRISKPNTKLYHELSESQDLDQKAIKKEVFGSWSSVTKALSNMTDTYYVSRGMSSYPKAPYSCLVLVSLHLHLKAMKLFECFKKGKEARFVGKQGRKIGYELLAIEVYRK